MCWQVAGKSLAGRNSLPFSVHSPDLSISSRGASLGVLWIFEPDLGIYPLLDYFKAQLFSAPVKSELNCDCSRLFVGTSLLHCEATILFVITSLIRILYRELETTIVLFPGRNVLYIILII